MRLWHFKLIKHLPRLQLLGQHRECCALRGNGWKKSHSTVNYVFEYSPNYLFFYHYKIMIEMQSRGYIVDLLWFDPSYRGKKCKPYSFECNDTLYNLFLRCVENKNYSEHDNDYLYECLNNLKRKKVNISIESLRI